MNLVSQQSNFVDGNERKFKAIFDTALDGFIILDDQMVIIDINKAGCELLGKSKKKLLGQSFLDYICPDEYKDMVKRWKNFLEKGKQRGELEVIVANDEERTLEYNATGDFYDGQHLFVFRDITDRKIEEKRQEHFLSIASHELRSPLASIKAFAQMLKRSLKDKVDDKTNSYISKVDDKADLMAGVISDLLDVTRIRQGKMIFFPEVFNFDIFVQEIVDDLQLTIKTHQIIIQGKSDIEIYADKNRIGQVIINLLRNAVKYSPDADKVIINISSIANGVIFSVQDFGVGISKTDLPKLFDLYYRGSDSKKNNISGLGVGLYISSEIIRNHGGRLWVESKKNKGSTFYVSLALVPNKRLINKS